MNRYARMSAGPAAFAGLLMLFYAWYAGGWVYSADASQFFVFTLHLFEWMLLIGGSLLQATDLTARAGALRESVETAARSLLS